MSVEGNGIFHNLFSRQREKEVLQFYPILG